MSVEYTQRFVTGDFAYAEIRADDFAEFVEASANLSDHLGTAAAVETVKKTFGKTTTVPATGGGFGNKGKQEAEPESVDLGEHDGYTVQARKSKFGGVYFNAYHAGTKERLNANGPKGLKVSEATLQDAIDALSAA